MNKKFVFYSLPQQSDFIYLENNDLGNHQLQFVSFDTQEKYVFRAEKLQHIKCESLNSISIHPQLQCAKDDYFEKENEYLSSITKLQEDMKEKQVKKVIYSRVKKIKGSINALATLQNLRKAYPQAFCYWMIAENGMSWLGATPETLLEEKEDKYVTMSLAGTLPLEEEWTEKEKEEQQLVTDYISEILDELQADYNVSEVSDISISNYKHLHQQINIDKNSVDFSESMHRLHPTSAICGMPKDEALQLIDKHEKHQRSLYAGYIYLKEKQEKSFVNIRCARVFKNEIHLYIGGGITFDSEAKKEWIETELKAETLEKQLVFQ